ncbi:MAG: alpha/beta hydrolase [Candidatus Izimaplasma sp.]|nr:alpha/beta hydrolase [Candidatus Izimaplasma bacterium]
MLKKIMRRTIIVIFAVVLILIGALFIYSRGSYTPKDEMYQAIDTIDISNITISEDFNEIKFEVSSPKKNIIFLPGGLVEPDSYRFLAVSLAHEGYTVTIVKPWFNLAIISPWQAKRFIDSSIENVIVGHSLGGVVASMTAANSDMIDEVILLGSYPISNLTTKDVLFITAEHDDNMNQEAFNDSLSHVSDDTLFYEITGGNHAQFGWYGPQKKDGEATITTLYQQQKVLEQILLFIK